MDLLMLVRVVGRRWYVFVPVLVATLALALVVQARTPSEYEATGWVILAKPELDPSQLPSAVVDLVELGGQLVADPPPDVAADDIAVFSRGENTYEVRAAASTAAEASGTVDRVVSALSERVQAVQSEADIPQFARLDVRPLTPRPVIQQQLDESFVAGSTILLHDPASNVQNPFGADASTVRVLEIAAQGDAAASEFQSRAGADIAYSVSTLSRDPAPLLQVVTSGPDPDAVVAAFDVVREILAEDLIARQERAGVPASRQITVAALNAPQAAVDISPPVNRAVAGTVVLGGLLALGLAIGTDNASARKRQPTERDLPTRNGVVDPSVRWPGAEGRARERGYGGDRTAAHEPREVARTGRSSRGSRPRSPGARRP